MAKTAEMQTMLGINLPWVTCGHDFGPRPEPWGGAAASPRDWSPVYEELARYADAGLSLVRFWVLAGGVNYPVGSGLAAYGALVQRKRRRRLRRHLALELRPGAPRPPLPEAFLDDFAGLLRAVRRAGLRAIPSLTSFEFFQPAVVLPDGLSKRGRGDLVFGSERGTDVGPFFDAALEPLLEVARAEASAVHSFELINEPGWAVVGGPLQVDRRAYGPLPSPQLVAPAQMSAFIDEGVGRIVGAGLLATVGFADPNPRWLSSSVLRRLRELAGRGQYLHQRHHYPTLLGDHTVPPHAASPITPCMLGELPTAMGGGLDNIRWRDRPLRATEHDPSRYLEARLRLIHDERDYPISLLWSARSGDSRRTWGDAQLAQVRRFVGSRHEN
ncbi:MAG: hypothetical protein DRJ42_04925 [Deltaproteobacteria bacterium]|nr:MAG: hypothetical protein DRJ42_04925 [Deltaproteobacteria bacterium]